MTPFPITGATLAYTPASEESEKQPHGGTSLTLLISTLATNLFCGQTKELLIWKNVHSKS